MLRKLFKTPRQLLVAYVCVINALSGVCGFLTWAFFLRNDSADATPTSPLIPLLITLAVAFPLSLLFSKSAVKPFTDIFFATQAMSKGDYSVRVDEVGEGEIRELLHGFNETAKELGRAETMRNDFVNTFSHEFETSIVSIRSFATQLRIEDLPLYKRQEYLSCIVWESERLSNLFSNIFLLSRYDHQHFIENQVTYSLNEQIRKCVLALEKQWNDKQIEFDIQMDEIFYVGNEEILDHVWMNLIENAIKFSPEGNIICISAAKRMGHIYVSITDEGIGMSREMMEHIFDRFQGASDHLSEENELGLALAKRIIDLCEGKIFVESAEGVGTTFCVSLPYDSCEKA